MSQNLLYLSRYLAKEARQLDRDGRRRSDHVLLGFHALFIMMFGSFFLNFHIWNLLNSFFYLEAGFEQLGMFLSRGSI